MSPAGPTSAFPRGIYLKSLSGNSFSDRAVTHYCAEMSERELAKYPGLAPRNGGVWYVRKRVPDDLQHILGSSDIRRSLKTTDRKEAVGRYHAEMAGIAEGFKRLRAELEAKGTIERGLSTGRIDLLGRAEVETLVAEWWGGREAVRKPRIAERCDTRLRHLISVGSSEGADLSRRSAPSVGLLPG